MGVFILREPPCSYLHSFNLHSDWSICVLHRGPTQAESVHPNCVLGRSVCLCLIVVLHFPSLFFYFFFFLNWPFLVKFGCLEMNKMFGSVKIYKWIVL